MKALALVFGFAAATAAVVALGTMHSSAAPASVTPTPQHFQLVVLNDADQMLGANIVAHPGRVVLTVVNRAHHAHLFSVPGLGVQQVVLPSSTTTFSFTVRDDVFPWFCKFPPCSYTMNGDIYVSNNPPSPHGPSWAPAV